jgi:hypothetical protein
VLGRGYTAKARSYKRPDRPLTRGNASQGPRFRGKHDHDRRLYVALTDGSAATICSVTELSAYSRSRNQPLLPRDLPENPPRENQKIQVAFDCPNCSYYLTITVEGVGEHGND